MGLSAAALTALAWLAQAAPASAPVTAPAPAASPQAEPGPAPDATTETATPGAPPTEPAPPAEPAPLAEPPPPSLPPPLPPPPPPPPVVRYGDRGSSDVSLALGYGGGGLVVGGGVRHFFRAGIGLGLEGTAQLGGSTKIGLLIASLRFVPLRTSSVALAITPKGGRVLLSDHDDGWAVGGDAAVIATIAPGAALELGYELLWLEPAGFCADLDTCVLRGPIFGLRLMF